jgi:O-antigen/teichoic acid export membrane protein
MMDGHVVKDKAVQGIKWTIILSSINIINLYVLQFILARISPKALGIYATFDIHIKTITTFVLFGGVMVLANFIPRTEKSRKSKLIIAYSIIVLLFMTLALMVFLCFPGILSFLYKRPISGKLFNLLLLMTPIITLNFLLQYILHAVFEIKKAKTTNIVSTVLTAITIIYLHLFHKTFLANNIFFVLLGSLLGFTLLSAIFGLYFVFRKTDVFSRPGFFLPKGFWSFSVFIHLGTVFLFLFKFLDRFIILKYFTLSELGVYNLVFQIVLISKTVPEWIGESLLPANVRLQYNDPEQVIRFNESVLRYNILISFTVSLVLISAAEYILRFFGQIYFERAYFLMLTMVFIFGINSPGNVYANLLISHEKMKYYFSLQVVMIVFQVVSSLFFLSSWGLSALVLSKGLTSLIGQAGCILKSRSLVPLRFPRQFWYAAFMLGTTFAIKWFILNNMIVNLILPMAVFAVFIKFSGYSRNELSNLRKIVFK